MEQYIGEAGRAADLADLDELGELIDIARTMTTERDVNKLLGVILEKSRFVTGADLPEFDPAAERL